MSQNQLRNQAMKRKKKKEIKQWSQNEDIKLLVLTINIELEIVSWI